MGKGDKNQKEKDPASSLNVNSVPNRDIMQRLNFMYQASTLLHSMASGSLGRAPEANPNVQDEKKKTSTQSSSNFSRKKAKGIRPRQDKKPKASRKGLDAVAQFYAQSIPVVAQRTTVKMDPYIKRGLCRGCNSPLIPGMTVTTRVKKQSSHGHSVVSQCNGCKTLQRIPAPAVLPSIFGLEKTSGTQKPLAEDSIAMEIDNPLPRLETNSTPPKRAPYRRELKHSRIPPLFARNDAGHVLFRGSERVDYKQNEER
ncbi:RNAse P Rpr2/Rpp21/SNM1 subunit domain-containing protein [Coprinopsis sp. MPI-PUGE-AT-0042]|nr:RNAse P Rpr2/Rpp21/SNM1 subunit domain-containing protein [Coprinopsis sp. MPI-PUGE-AT-0042]